MRHEFELIGVLGSRTGAVFQLVFDSHSNPSAIVISQRHSDYSALQILLFDSIDSFSSASLEWLFGQVSVMIRNHTGFLPRQIHVFSTVYDRVLRDPQELRLRVSRSSLDPSYYLTVAALSLQNFESGAFEETNYSRTATVFCMDDLEPRAVGIIFEDPLLDSEEEQDHFMEWLRGTLKWPDDVAIVFKVCARLVAIVEPE